MNPTGFSGQHGSSSRVPMVADEQSRKGNAQVKKGGSLVMPPEYTSKQSAYSSQDLPTVDTVYKIVWSDRPEYSLNGNLFIRYNVPPEIHSIGWFCIVAFHWHDVQAEFECIYYPSIRLFDNFKPIEGSLRGGSRGVQGVQISMWNFAYRGPDLNPKHAVKDDNGNRIMLAIMIMPDGSMVRLHGKMVREGENEDEVWLSRDERGRLGLRS